MTHDELLAKIDEAPVNMTIDSEGNPTYWYSDNPTKKALRAVVELHKPITKTDASIFSSSLDSRGQQMVTRVSCDICHWRYPCDTIEAIQEQLK